MKFRFFAWPLSFVFVLAGLSACGQLGSSSTEVILGDQRPDIFLPLLKGKRVAIFSNHSGIVGDVVGGKPSRKEVDEESVKVPFMAPGDPSLGPHILDFLLEHGVDVKAIFSPEHGFRGVADAGEHVGSSVDPGTGVPILSLYEGGKGRPSDESMEVFDVLVVDIQDVGLRYYTYYVTLQKLMSACAEFGKKVVLLDRPNPNGFYVDGPILDMSLKSGVGSLPIPIVHGMTLGELAGMMNGEGWLVDGRICDLAVVSCLNYTHSTLYSLILPPSPNLKDMKSVYLYSSTCFFEGTRVSLGRGTDHPFEMYGHPDMKDQPYMFTPRSVPGAKNPPLLDQECHGKDLHDALPLKDILANGVDLSYVVDAYSALNYQGSGAQGEEFFLKNGFFNLLTGDRSVKTSILEGKSADEISATWKDDVKTFLDLRAPYLLYPEK